MTSRLASVLLLVAIVLSGCSKTETVNTTDFTVEVFPGTYISNSTTDLPLPTAGYTIYFVGETHGNQEAKQVFEVYLKNLYREAGVRDVILEEDQAFETEANAFVHGQLDQLPEDLCLRTDILAKIREFNATLPANDQVNVHLVDVDSPMPTVYKHLEELYQQLGSEATSLDLPTYSDFNTAPPMERYELVDHLQKLAVDQPQIENGLSTVHFSLRWYSLGNRMGTGSVSGLRRNFFPLREDVITQNVQYVLQQLDGKPVLVFFGGAHGMKAIADPDLPADGFKSWTQRLSESGVPVYSMLVDGLSGEGYWRREAFQYGEGMDEYRFENGTSIISLFDDYVDTTIIYTDLREKENQNIRLPGELPDVPASKVFDGLIIFQKFTPMENACQ